MMFISSSKANTKSKFFGSDLLQFASNSTQPKQILSGLVRTMSSRVQNYEFLVDAVG